MVEYLSFLWIMRLVDSVLHDKIYETIGLYETITFKEKQYVENFYICQSCLVIVYKHFIFLAHVSLIYGIVARKMNSTLLNNCSKYRTFFAFVIWLRWYSSMYDKKDTANWV